MNKKTALISSGFLLCVILISSSVSAASPFDAITDPIKKALELESEIEIYVDEKLSTDGIIIAPETYKNVTVNVRYRLNVKPFVSKLLLESKIGKLLFFKNVDANPEMKINIKAITSDPWNCNVIGGEKTVKLNMSNEFQETSVNFKISVDPNDEPLKNVDIAFTASNSPGDLNIQRVEDTATAKVIYGGKVEISVFGFSLDLIKPGEESVAPMTVKNWGNIDTIVDVELENTPETWDVDFNSSSFNLEPLSSKTIQVKMKPKSISCKDETARLKFSPRANVDLDFTDDSFYGEEQYVKIELLGTNIDDIKTNTQDTPGFDIASFAIAAMIVSLILVLSRKKK